MVEATGQVDYINTSIGVATASLFMIEASMHIPPGYSMFIPSALRKAVDLPIVGRRPFQGSAAGRTGTGRRATATSSGWCVARSPIAEFAAKGTWRVHRRGAPVPVSCNQECVGRMGLNRWLGCIENPRTGREHEYCRASGEGERTRRCVLLRHRGPSAC